MLKDGGHACLRGRGLEFESWYELNQGEAFLVKQAACCPLHELPELLPIGFS